MCNVMKRLGMSVGKNFAKFAKKAGNRRVAQAEKACDPSQKSKRKSKRITTDKSYGPGMMVNHD